MNEYHIILEEVLTPETRRKYLDYMRAKGWIHTNVMTKKKKDDTYFLSITCTPELLGKVVGYLLSQVGWIIVEQVGGQTLNRKEMADIQYIIPF